MPVEGCVAVSFQWDATSDVMEDWMYETYAEKYDLDKKCRIGCERSIRGRFTALPMFACPS